ASARLLRTLAVVEAAVLAVVGWLVGVIGYVLLRPLAGLLRFAGGPIGTAGMWLGVPGALIVLAAIVLIGVAASIGGLRSIEITPLGVRTRQRPARVHWLRIVAAVTLLGAAQLFANTAGVGSMMIVVVIVLAAFGEPILDLHFIGQLVSMIVTIMLLLLSV